MSKRSHRGLAFPPLVLGARPDQEADALAASTSEGAEVSAAHRPLSVSMGWQVASGSTPPVLVVAPLATMEDMLEPEPLILMPSDPEQPLAAPKTPEPLAERRPAKEAKAKAAALRDAADPVPAAKMARSSAPRLPIWARLAYPSAIVLAAVWAGVMIAFPAGYQGSGPFDYKPFPVTVFTALAVLPAIFMILGAYVLRQAARLSLETRNARDLAGDLGIPAALAADQAAGAAEAVRREIALATEAGEAAERQLLALRQALAEESDRLVAATAQAERAARALTDSLSQEREGMASLTATLDHQVAAVSDAIVRHTDMVAQTSDLAAAQLQEAEAALAARATDLAAAAGEAGEAAELAGEALARQAERLENAGELVGARLQSLNDELGRGHSRLADLAVRLQADQQALSARLEAQQAAAASANAIMQSGAVAASEAAHGVAASLRDLIAEADERLRAVAEGVQGEQAALDARARASLSLFRGAVADERAGIEAEANAAIAGLAETARQTRQAALADLETASDAATASAEAARAKVEQLGEAAFAASQKADHAFDTRIASARRSIEQSAALVEAAGQQSVGRIDAGLAATRDTLGQLEALLASVDQRIAAAPAEARSQADALRVAVQAGMGEIAAAAKSAVAETEAVDLAFQERVRRNYEMLSEALQTMSKVAAATEQAAARAAPPAPAPVAAPVAPAAPPHAAPAPAPAAMRASYASAQPLSVAPEQAIRFPAAPPEPALRPAALAAPEMGLRPRLRLTAEDEMLLAREAVVPARPASEREAPKVRSNLDGFDRTPPRPTAPPKDTTAWTWKDLLSSIDEPPIDDEVLAERLITEIESLGLDAASLLPLSQIDAIAGAMQRGDVEAVREAVRGLAPGAVRRLSRRVLTDKVLRAQADRYVRRYEDLLNDSARRDREGFMTAALLGSDPGRAFLLFDAAVGELH